MRFVPHPAVGEYDVYYKGISSLHPVHTYNISGLFWAMISRWADMEPIKLWLNAIVFFAPLAVLSIYSLGKSLFGKQTVAFAIAMLYLGYQLI